MGTNINNVTEPSKSTSKNTFLRVLGNIILTATIAVSVLAIIAVVGLVNNPDEAHESLFAEVIHPLLSTGIFGPAETVISRSELREAASTPSPEAI